MGCDIHLHIEVKINDKWEHYSHPRIPRDYRLFYKIARVRGPYEIDDPWKPKGLPENLSLITQIDYDYDGSDAHSASWLNKQEIEEICNFMEQRYEPKGLWAHENLGYANGNCFSTIGESGHPKEYKDVRFVFWFDN